MPELPEVETIRLGLQKYLVGHKIEKVEVKLGKMVTGDIKRLAGGKIKDVRRFGKGLVIDLDNEYSLAIHIKLTGQLIYRGIEAQRFKVSEQKVGEVPNKFTHVIFHLDKGAFLYYNDQRQFGWIKIIQTSKLKEISFFKDLGPEPFKDLTPKLFKEIVLKGNIPIKVLLLDQKRIGGIGNIYANDALFDSGIDPRRKAKSLTETEIKKLYDSVLKVLKKGLENGGASELNYVNALGQEGKYQHHFLVYGQEGKKCKNCASVIKKIKLGGRGTYFCQNCQK